MFVMILLLRSENEIDRVRERGMRDVVQQARDLFAAWGPQPPQQDEDAQAVLVSRHVLERKGQSRRTGLPDSLQSLKCRATDQIKDLAVLDRNRSRKPDPATASTRVS